MDLLNNASTDRVAAHDMEFDKQLFKMIHKEIFLVGDKN